MGFLKFMGNVFLGVVLFVVALVIFILSSSLNQDWLILVGLIVAVSGAYFMRNSFRH